MDVKDLKITVPDKLTGEEFFKLKYLGEHMQRLQSDFKAASHELDAMFLELRAKYNADGLDMEKGGLIIRNEKPAEVVEVPKDA